MKKLDVSQMENLQGGLSQRNCALLGVVIGLSGFGGSLAILGAVGAAAAADCF
jgi:hypothetical protein